MRRDSGGRGGRPRRRVEVTVLRPRRAQTITIDALTIVCARHYPMRRPGEKGITGFAFLSGVAGGLVALGDVRSVGRYFPRGPPPRMVSYSQARAYRQARSAVAGEMFR